MEVRLLLCNECVATNCAASELLAPYKPKNAKRARKEEDGTPTERKEEEIPTEKNEDKPAERKEDDKQAME